MVNTRGASPKPAGNPRRYSFGSTAAIVTSKGIIVGFDAATMPRAAVVRSLLVIALADNIADSLSIHVYQESEKLEERAAFRTTLTNFVARFLVVLTFIGWAVLLPSRWAVPLDAAKMAVIAPLGRRRAVDAPGFRSPNHQRTHEHAR